jgi:hypothetical protein
MDPEVDHLGSGLIETPMRRDPSQGWTQVPRYQMFFRTSEQGNAWAPGGELFLVALAVVLAIVGVLAWRWHRTRRAP